MTKDERIRQVIELHLSGYKRADILDLLRADKVRGAEAFLDSALALVEVVMGTADMDKAWFLGSLRLLYQKNMEISDLKNAHLVLRDMMVLTGVKGDAAREEQLNAVRGKKKGEE